MQALVLKNAKTPEIGLIEMEKPNPGPGQVLIKMKAAALNRRDFYISTGKYPGLKPGIILGSDGCGLVVRVHDQSQIEWEGEEVIINPNVNWGLSESAQAMDYRVLGMPDHGTFAEYIVVNTDRLSKKPAHLNAEKAAALPLAGLTAFRTVFTQAQVKPAQKLLVTGIGGGVAQMILKFGLALGADCYVTSGDTHKIEKAVQQGATAGYNYKEASWYQSEEIPEEGFRYIIDSAGGDSINHYIQLIEPGGSIVIYGSTTGKTGSFDTFRLFWKQATLRGSTMGSDREFEQMITYVNEHKIEPEVDRVALFGNIGSQFDRIRKSEHYGKLVVVF